MSDILIKGMEMPKDGCHHMICIYADGTVLTGGRVYKAVPVPPHRDLIDRDELKKKELVIDGIIYYYEPISIEEAPVIIPASEEGE